MRSLGAETVIDYRSDKLDYTAWKVDAVIDLVGGEEREKSSRALKQGGVLVSVVSPDPFVSALRYALRLLLCRRDDCKAEYDF